MGGKKPASDYPERRLRAMEFDCPFCGAKRKERCRRFVPGFTSEKAELVAYVHGERVRKVNH